jgi:hypothetical protein
MTILNPFRLVFCGLFTGIVAQGQVTTFSGLNLAIPDGNLSGLVNVQTVSGIVGYLSDLDVTLNITGTGYGAVNGDYYVRLEHNGATAILLNRTGLRTGSLIGYDDNGFQNVTFSDSAANGDVHNYRIGLTGNNTTRISPAPSPLTGTWAPDGRDVSPLTVLATDTPSPAHMLSAFNGMDANGTWKLYLVDAQSGGTGQLNDWSMQITAVPEPATVAFWFALPLLGFGVWRKCRSNTIAAHEE